MYREMIMTSQVFLRDCTAIEPEQIILFGGYALDKVNPSKSGEQMVVGTSDDRPVRVLDDWIVLEGSDDTIDLLSYARQGIDAALDFKVMQPRKPLPDASQSIVDAICDVYRILDERD
jgi:ATP-dependent RNA helicase DHX36